MVSENTVKTYFKKALEPYIAGHTYSENRGGYSVKKNVYALDESDLAEIQKSVKYGEVHLGDDEVYCFYDGNGERYFLSECICVKEVTPIDSHHTYGTRMIDGYTIEEIIKQSEKAIYVRVKSDTSDFRYERWLPKTTVYEIKREMGKTEGVISKWTNTQFDESYRVLVRGTFHPKAHSDMTYGDKAHADKRIADLMAEGYVVYSTETNEQTGETEIVMATPYSIKFWPYFNELEEAREKWSNDEISNEVYNEVKFKVRCIESYITKKMDAGIQI